MLRVEANKQCVERKFSPRKVQVSITSYRARLCDEVDNFRAGFKPVFDALRDEGLIWDDGPDWLVPGECRQEVDRQNRRTEITLLAGGVE